ncbi:hypothetical protein PsorP6_012391 [Peronosclerospora sorghi]|uniref:Uncharacterized protein n=1 Tax=Peronosclerospora sorghi TaxID=230839 RepID=A0ACC0WGS4_9STRA|nr:hypothetical protein PsorP6_012391 [Peronosclerospora sorghi]
MIVGAARGLFQSARQVRRAAARQGQKHRKVQKEGGTRKNFCDLAREEGVITKQQKQTFGRGQYSDTLKIPHILAVGAAGMLNVGSIDGLNLLIRDLADDDDDGR